jgi:transporter family protein
MRWLFFALAAAAANATAGTLAKAGLAKAPPALATALTAVVAAIGTIVFAFVKRDGKLADLSRKDAIWLVLAGLATAASYTLYFFALDGGKSSRVQPVDRLSLVFAIVLAVIFLHEKLSVRLVLGALVMVGGALLVATDPAAK